MVTTILAYIGVWLPRILIGGFAVLVLIAWIKEFRDGNLFVRELTLTFLAIAFVIALIAFHQWGMKTLAKW